MRQASSYVAAAAVSVAIVAGVAWSLTASSAVPDSLVREGPYAFKAVPAGADGPLKECVVCHSVEPGGALRVAPALNGIVDAPKARAAWYGYSPALKAAGGTWSEADLDKFLASPSKFLPGTTMSIVGIPDAAQRAEIIAALKKT